MRRGRAITLLLVAACTSSQPAVLAQKHGAGAAPAMTAVPEPRQSEAAPTPSSGVVVFVLRRRVLGDPIEGDLLLLRQGDPEDVLRIPTPGTVPSGTPFPLTVPSGAYKVGFDGPRYRAEPDEVLVVDGGAPPTVELELANRMELWLPGF